MEIQKLFQQTEIQVNLTADVAQYYESKTVLVTGASGSIGGSICQQLCKLNPDKIILFDQDESGLYDLYQSLITQFPNQKIEVVLGSISDRQAVESLFEKQIPNVVFHAAAYKHVPILELHPLEAVRVNVMGLKIVADASAKWNVEDFVFVSSDKAVKPRGILGATKRVGEVYLSLMSGKKVRYICCRFGNVLDSSGSILPLFRMQIANGGPLTVTHVEATRYFMSMSEAILFLLQSGFYGKNGDIFSFNMGQPVKILDIAKHLIQKEKSIDIRIIGLRNGEKLHEENLITDSVGPMLWNNKVYRVSTNGMDVDAFVQQMDTLQSQVNEYNKVGVATTLREMLPEYL